MQGGFHRAVVEIIRRAKWQTRPGKGGDILWTCMARAGNPSLHFPHPLLTAIHVYLVYDELWDGQIICGESRLLTEAYEALDSWLAFLEQFSE